MSGVGGRGGACANPRPVTIASASVTYERVIEKNNTAPSAGLFHPGVVPIHMSCRPSNALAAGVDNRAAGRRGRAAGKPLDRGDVCLRLDKRRVPGVAVDAADGRD